MTHTTGDSPLPGQELVEAGLADLAAGRETECSLLLMVAAPRLGSLGLKLPKWEHARPAEHALYELVEERLGDGAHSHYNSLLRRIVSYARALERQQRR
jgi:hypothetical protein